MNELRGGLKARIPVGHEDRYFSEEDLREIQRQIRSGPLLSDTVDVIDGLLSYVIKTWILTNPDWNPPLTPEELELVDARVAEIIHWDKKPFTPSGNWADALLAAHESRLFLHGFVLGQSSHNWYVSRFSQGALDPWSPIALDRNGPLCLSKAIIRKHDGIPRRKEEGCIDQLPDRSFLKEI